MLGRTLTGVMALVAVSSLGCSDGAADEAQPYADAFATFMLGAEDDGPFEEFMEEFEDEVGCWTARVVGVIGVERFESEGITPEDISASGIEEFGLDLSDKQARSIAEFYVGCGFTPFNVLGGVSDSDELRTCIDLRASDDQLVEAIRLGFAGEPDAQWAQLERMQDALVGCPDH